MNHEPMPAQGPVDVNVRPVVSMTPGEVTAIINNPYGLHLLMDWHDFQYCQAESMVGPGEIEPWPTARFTALRDKGRAIIAEDLELWDEDIKREFGFDGPNAEVSCAASSRPLDCRVRAMAKKKPTLVQIEWRDPESDWPWFWLLNMRGEWLHLQGADYPDGSAKHDGDCFWVHKSDVRNMRSNAK